MAAIASAPPPPTSHTIELARPAGLGGAAKAQRATRSSQPQPQLARVLQAPTEVPRQAMLPKHRILLGRWETNKDLQPLTHTNEPGAAEKKWPTDACAT